MNNNIPFRYCSNEASLALKRNGFDVRCDLSIKIKRPIDFSNVFSSKPKSANIIEGSFTNTELDSEIDGSYVAFTVPIQQVATDWIKENFDVHIWCEEVYGDYVPKFKTNRGKITQLPSEKSVKEAIDAVIVKFLFRKPDPKVFKHGK